MHLWISQAGLPIEVLGAFGYELMVQYIAIYIRRRVTCCRTKFSTIFLRRLSQSSRLITKASVSISMGAHKSLDGHRPHIPSNDSGTHRIRTIRLDDVRRRRSRVGLKWVDEANLQSAQRQAMWQRYKSLQPNSKIGRLILVVVCHSVSSNVGRRTAFIGYMRSHGTNELQSHSRPQMSVASNHCMAFILDIPAL